MKGNNTLHINQATLVQALQMLCDAQMPGHQVQAVEMVNNYGTTEAKVSIVDAPASDDGKTLDACKERGGP